METPTSSFVSRHVGPRAHEQKEMLRELGLDSLEALIAKTVPLGIRSRKPLAIERGLDEAAALAELREISKKNQVFRSFIGMGYVGTETPAVIQRNILENPGWYTQYTPYQAEIAQGRLEALLNFQTMVMDLTGMEIANASLLDEATAAAEAMAMLFAAQGRDGSKAFLVDHLCHPQTIAVVRTRAQYMGIRVVVTDLPSGVKEPAFGALIQYPATDGSLVDWTNWIQNAASQGIKTVMAADLMSLALLKSPGELGADVAVGSTQCFGVPMGFGGPHAAYFATRDSFKRLVPGRLVGVSKDAQGRPGVRLALQTREQHIRRDKATSNICTAQVLLAVIAGMYAVYHGPEGVRAIAETIHRHTAMLAAALTAAGHRVNTAFLSTLRVELQNQTADAFMAEARKRGINVRKLSATGIAITCDETTSRKDLEDLAACGGAKLSASAKEAIPPSLKRTSAYLKHAVFNSFHSETEMLRYIRKLEGRDLSLTHSMIPLGSCTMKLNATTEMFPVTWPEFGSLHPFAPAEQTAGYRELFTRLEKQLSEITGFAGVSLQPNAGSQGEYAGLLTIRKYQESQGQGHRDICLIPQSAHGTNPASAAMAGMKVVVVACDDQGNVDVADLQAKTTEHQANLSTLMVTYPSTHGVFEEKIREICEIIHRAGGQVYMDGANMNAQVGLCRPGDFGPDVCHLNLHKTFCIPHGGGGPGMGPIGVREHLIPYLPNHPFGPWKDRKGVEAISAAPYGSPSILPIPYLYIRMMGGEGLKQATEVAILNANYITKRLSNHYPVLYEGSQGFVAHECILDLRPLKENSGVEVEDVAKRLIDYGFHAPTISFPVAGTVMIEPTESESKAELDRFCEAMIAIRQEIAAIESGKQDKKINLLKNAPHTAEMVSATDWKQPYSREQAAYPLPWVRERKFWPYVARIDNVYGDRNLFCSCQPESVT